VQANSFKKCPDGYNFREARTKDGEEKPKGFDVEVHTSKNWDTKEITIKMQNKKNADRLLVEERKLQLLEKHMTKSATFHGWGDLPRRLVAGIVANCPKVSALELEGVCPMFLGAFLMSVGHHVSVEQLARICPSRTTFEDLVKEFAAESAIILQEAFKHSKQLHMSHDKADGMKGFGRNSQLLATWDDCIVTEEFPDGRIVVAPIDVDKSGDSSVDEAEKIAHSLEKMNLSENVVVVGITFDSGGGGSVESGVRALSRQGRVNVTVGCMVGNCMLHNLNLEIVNAMKKFLKGAADDKQKRKDDVTRNAEQFIFSAFKWEHETGVNVVEVFWDSSAEYCYCHEYEEEEGEEGDGTDKNNKDYKYVIIMFDTLERGDKFVSMKRGAETRWWTIGEAACVLYDTLPMRTFMARNFDDMKLSGKAQKMAQTFLSLSEIEVLVCDLALLKCYHHFYLPKHLKFYQTADRFC
jgi:hypothetical protein